MKFEFSHILRVCHYFYVLCITISFGHVNSYAKIFKILHEAGGNATTQLTLVRKTGNTKKSVEQEAERFEQ